MVILAVNMSSQSGYIQTGKQQLHYTKYGSGGQLIIAFHGYGDDEYFFQPLVPYLGEDYSLLSFSLPYHAESHWPDDVTWSLDDIQDLIRNTLTTFQVERFSLMGYSIGGRICMKIVELMPDEINRLVLIASDGLRFNWFYYFLTRTIIGKGLFKSFLNNPKPYMPFLKLARNLGFIDKSRYKFAMKYITEEDDRLFLLHVWSATSLMIPNYPILKKSINIYEIKTYLFLGLRDRVIPAELGGVFTKGIDQTNSIIFDKGHRLFDAETFPHIAKCFP